MGVPAPAGAQWRRSGVIVILRNDVYCGKRCGVKNAHAAIIARRAFNGVARTLARTGRSGT
jgi:hypothetical protein